MATRTLNGRAKRDDRIVTANDPAIKGSIPKSGGE
jgi:hypothetical protein